MIQGQALVQSLFIIQDYNTWHSVSPFAYRLLTYMWNMHCKRILVNVLFNTKQNKTKKTPENITFKV